jgi:hypothetical protein
MTTYILLRLNKESKPMSLDDLVRAGLKADDLIWVEGQSACWLRPGEIRSLKDLVGVPPVQTVKPVETSSVYQPLPVVTETETAPLQESKVVSNEAKENIELKDTKRVFVAMPAGKKPVEIKKEEPIDYYQSYLPKKDPVPVLKKVIPLGDEEDTIEPETRYSKPLDEIKEMYVKNLEKQKRGRNLQLVISPQIRKASVYAGLILVGLLAGIIIKNAGAKKNTLTSKVAPIEPKASNPTVENLQDTTGSVVPVRENNVVNENTNEVQQPITYEEKQPGKIIEHDENKIIPENQDRVKDPDPNDITLPAKNGERNSQTRNDAKTAAIDEIASRVSLKSNDYIVGSFGGIRNLEITLRNDSKYTLDHVTVELQYLKPRDEVLRTENIYFQSIPPNASQTLPVKKSARGIKVAYKVVKIESKEINANTAGL